MKHHTKTKGDKALGFVVAEMYKNGIGVCLPMSEHHPFDFIAVSENGELSRVQVRHVKESDGQIHIPLANIYGKRAGNVIHTLDRRQFDCFAVYCPEAQKVYYVSCLDIPEKAKRVFTLRTSVKQVQTGLNSSKMASDYENHLAIFKRPSQ